jgi:hypothetical protein
MIFSLLKRKAAAAQDSQMRDINPTFRKYICSDLMLARRLPRQTAMNENELGFEHWIDTIRDISESILPILLIRMDQHPGPTQKHSLISRSPSISSFHIHD